MWGQSTYTHGGYYKDIERKYVYDLKYRYFDSL